MPIGKFLELSEDSNGLYAVAQLGNSTLGKDAYEDYKDGIIREHSIGFQYVKDKIDYIENEDDETKSFYEVKEVILWEGSAVTFGSNEYTNVLDVSKGLLQEDKIEQEANLRGTMTFRNWTDSILNEAIVGEKIEGTDNRLYQLEMKVKLLNSQLFTLATTNPFTKQLEVQKPKIKNEFNWCEVMNKINV